MDDSLQEFEAELKALTPRGPSAQLTDRVASGLAATAVPPAEARPRYTSSTNLSSWKWLGWRTAGLTAAAAALMLTAVLKYSGSAASATGQPSSQTAPVVAAAPIDTYQPVTATNVLYDMKDEGLVKTDDDTDARRMRYRYLDTYTWKNPKTNASIKWSVPRDEIRLVAANLN